MFRPTFVDHLVFRVADLERSERFYTALLGEPVYRTKDSVMYMAGDTRLFFSEAGDDRRAPYDKERVGLNHLAFGVSSLQELQGFEAQLNAVGMTHSGLTLDAYGQKEFIWLDDPDDMRIEFYLRVK